MRCCHESYGARYASFTSDDMRPGRVLHIRFAPREKALRPRTGSGKNGA